MIITDIDLEMVPHMERGFLSKQDYYNNEAVYLDKGNTYNLKVEFSGEFDSGEMISELEEMGIDFVWFNPAVGERKWKCIFKFESDSEKLGMLIAIPKK